MKDTVKWNEKSQIGAGVGDVFSKEIPEKRLLTKTYKELLSQV
jgi:hypothetical protein